MDMQRLDGRSIAVTGATAGIGYFVAEGLATLGAEVIVAARSEDRARRAIAQLPGTGHRFLPLDLAARSSVEAAGAELSNAPLHGLVLNAGVIAAPRNRRDGDRGVESTVGVNYLAHADLVRRVIPALDRAREARVVVLGSMITTRIPFDRSNWLAQQSYSPRVAYAMSKHALEIFGMELGRRLRARGSGIRSIVVHPGGAVDLLTADRPGIHERPVVARVAATAFRPLFRSIAHGKDEAAASAILALTALDLPDDAYLGPRRTVTGEPGLAEPVPSTRNPELGQWLWRRTEELLGGRMLED